ncbi:hypothetical protein S7711_01551 [Stachybotrys chartarum IBT 7711]|uniref:AMP-dependent synthetase/ligase domain-containing protein n=1 Tax=Stachybotrys chartarum (strain CBS 109288 / IBT 7711) TaxID=1280523 RepID=A0A084BC12_STACB|nr:hypothetical protein S7711_01551 [Stachybotrys chartarum IBT 7711]
MSQPNSNPKDSQWWLPRQYAVYGPMAEVHGKPCLDQELNLWQVFSKSASLHPTSDAAVSMWQAKKCTPETKGTSPDDASTCRWSYQDLHRGAEELADILQCQCAPNKAGRPLVGLLWNSAEWALCFWAAAKMGVPFVPIDPRTSWDDMAKMIALVQPQMVLLNQLQHYEAKERKQRRKMDNIEPSFLIPCLGELYGSKAYIAASRKHAPKLDSLQESVSIRKDAALIVFTSGTTGEPKGCVHTHSNLVSQMYDYDTNPATSASGRWLVHTPVSHVFGINNALRAWSKGAAVVFPSKSFEVGASIRALKEERCTAMSAVPTMVKMLLENPQMPHKKHLHLNYIILGGASIDSDIIKTCQEVLGAKVTLQAYGMSEGAPLISWSQHDPKFKDQPPTGAGRVLPGVAIRICKPDSREVLSFGQEGELHIAGDSVISTYLGERGRQPFYDHNQKTWLPTGDQASLDADGVVHILGRYKDLIIRGGRNIYPAKLESELAAIPGQQAALIGIPDDFAGQLAVLIIKPAEGTTYDAEYISRLRDMCTSWIVDVIYNLKDIGFDTFPMTTLGKIKKGVLREGVIKHRLGNILANATDGIPSKHTQNNKTDLLVDKLTNVWEQVTGHQPAATDRIRDLGDSITLLQFCEALFRREDRRIYLQDFQPLLTFKNLADRFEEGGLGPNQRLMSSRLPGRLPGSIFLDTAERDKAIERSPSCPNALLDEECLKLHPPAEKRLLSDKQSSIHGLGARGLRVENLLPIRCSLRRMVIGQRPQSYHVRMVYSTAAPTSTIRKALEAVICSRQVLRALFDKEDLRQSQSLRHSIIEPCQELFDQLIFESEVQQALDMTDTFNEFAMLSHPSMFMFKAEIVNVPGRMTRYVVLTWNHSIVDAISIVSIIQDMKQQIANPGMTIQSQTPYSMFLDLVTDFSGSKSETESVRFHVQRLRGISIQPGVLWPKLVAPGTMISHDQDSEYYQSRRKIRQRLQWEDEDATGESPTRNTKQFPRISKVVNLPQLALLQRDHNISPVIFTQCALILFNTIQTRQPHAVFTTWNSGRSWPFVPAWMKPILPAAMSIDGPTVQWVLNRFKLTEKEGLLSFFQRIKSELQQAQQHEHAPWDKIVAGLEEEGPFAEDASYRQSFVWDLSIGFNQRQETFNDGEELTPIARFDWADSAFFWNAYMIDNDNLQFIASWDTAQTTVKQVDKCCDLLADLMHYMAEQQAWQEPVEKIWMRLKPPFHLGDRE